MNKREVAHMLRTMGTLLEIKGEDPFKSRSYARAADSIEDLDQDLEEMAKSGRLMEIPGVGKNLEPKVRELVLTGRSTFLENLIHEVPEGLLDLLRVPGIGAKTARMLHVQLGIQGLDDLEEAIEAHRIQSLPGLGPKREDLMRRGLREIRKYTGRISLGVALPVAESLVGSLVSRGIKVQIVGEVRRFEETVSSVDIMVVAPEGEDIFDVVKMSGIFPAVSREDLIPAFDRSSRSFTFGTGFGVPLRLFFSSPDEAGLKMLALTGPKSFVEFVQKHKSPSESEKKSLSNGVSSPDSQEIALLEMLGFGYIPPEVRHLDEFCQKAGLRQPIRLIETNDIAGDIHLHTDWSDGVASIEDMVKACVEMGYSYVAITDHASELKLVNGLDAARLEAQIEEISRLRVKYPQIRIYSGTEVDIGKSGGLHLPDSVLAALDVVIASIHNDIGDASKDIVKRLVDAAHNPHVDIIGHPTGRLIGRRPGYTGDLGKLFEAAAETNTALEINSSPDRLDLPPELVREAKEAGAKFSIVTDAHSVRGLSTMRYGVLCCARRAGLCPGQVINAGEKLPWLP